MIAFVVVIVVVGVYLAGLPGFEITGGLVSKRLAHHQLGNSTMRTKCDLIAFLMKKEKELLVS